MLPMNPMFIGVFLPFAVKCSRKQKPSCPWLLFVNMLNGLNPNLAHRRKRLKKHCEGLRANAPKQILHMDLTIFRPSDHSRVYIYLIMDNFSRAILGYNA